MNKTTTPRVMQPVSECLVAVTGVLEYHKSWIMDKLTLALVKEVGLDTSFAFFFFASHVADALSRSAGINQHNLFKFPHLRGT